MSEQAAVPNPSVTPPSPERRRFLRNVTTAVGVAGVAAAAVPFLAYWNPSERALANALPVDVDISKMEKGQKITVSWRRKPVWVIRRTKAELAELHKISSMLKDPQSTAAQQSPLLKHFDPVTRAVRPEYLVLVAICTHLGCVPQYVPQPGSASGLGPSWPGGFFCPCHGSRYDLSGRVMNGSPAPLNLPVPPYYYLHNTVIRVGEVNDSGKGANWAPAIW